MKKVFNKRILISVLILFSYFSILFILAQSPQEVIFDPIRDLFANWEEGNLSINIAKYLFLLLITLFVWSILDFGGIIPSKTVTWIISFMIAFLSIAYVAPQQIWILLTGFDALGLTLIFFVPLIVLGLFTLRVAAVGGARGVLAQRLIWFVYFLFLVGNFVSGMVNNRINVSEPFAWVYIGAIFLVICVVFFNKFIIKWLGIAELEAESEAAGKTLERAVRLRRMEAEALRKQAA
ncbi:hypothetical protein J4221_02315 [Candidatus Pacearchaeota archaeon]|nr:hypothetical protein [Candidatus Pacearchaeota archaeon]